MLYPVFLKLDGRLAVVVGGGEVARRKAEDLLDAGARVRVVAPDIGAGLTALAGVEAVREHFRASHLDGAALAIAATDEPSVNVAVAEAGRARGVWVNVVDEPELCDFFAGSRWRADPVQVAVSTGGAAPGYARIVRDRVAQALSPALGQVAARLSAVRLEVRRRVTGDPRARAAVMARVLDPAVLGLLESGDEAGFDVAVTHILESLS